MAAGSGPGGPLERFLSIFGTVFDSTKTEVERLLDNYDVANVQLELLPYIDALIGWETNFELSGSRRRGETLNAVSLYKRKGRPDAIEAFVENIADWDTTLHEGWRYVFFSNDTRCTTPIPSAVNVGLVGTPGDELKYTPTQEDFHSTNGLLVELAPVTAVTEEIAGITLQKIDRLLPRFVPSWANLNTLLNMPVTEETIGVPVEEFDEGDFDSLRFEPPFYLTVEDDDLTVWGAGILLMVSNEVTRTANTASVKTHHSGVGYAGTAPPPAYDPIP